MSTDAAASSRISTFGRRSNARARQISWRCPTLKTKNKLLKKLKIPQIAATLAYHMLQFLG